jgi:Rad3-related DNA helicase
MRTLYEVFNQSEIIQFSNKSDANLCLLDKNSKAKKAEEIFSLKTVEIEDIPSESQPSYQQFLTDLDSLYAELIFDNRNAVYGGAELALTVADQAEGIYSLCRSALSQTLTENDIRNLQFRVDSIVGLLSEGQRNRLKNSAETNNMPIAIPA